MCLCTETGQPLLCQQTCFSNGFVSDEEDTLEEMRRSELGGASMNTHDEPPNEKFENSVRETI